MRYLVRRAAYAPLLLASVSILSFGFLQLAPGDYFDSLRLNPRVSRETLATLRAKNAGGLPLPARYGRWLLSIAEGDWGYSIAYQAPASDILWPRACNTLLLTGFGTLLAWMCALPLGLLGAAWQDTPARWIFQVALAAALAVPDVLIALLFLLVAVRSGSLPSSGITSASGLMSSGSRARDLAAHFLLPVLCLVLASLPMLVAHVRSAVGETLQLPSVRAARGYGISPFRLMTRHVLPAAANPLVSLLGLSAGTLLSSSLIVEIVFNWPGLGRLLLESLLQRDFYVVVDIAVLSSLFLLTGNLLADLALYFADPRIRKV